MSAAAIVLSLWAAAMTAMGIRRLGVRAWLHNAGIVARLVVPAAAAGATIALLWGWAA